MHKSYTKLTTVGCLWLNLSQLGVDLNERMIIFALVSKLDRVLRELYPGSESYTTDQVVFARRAIRLAMRECSKAGVPRSEVAVGEVFMSKGVRYRCVLRPSGIEPAEACRGCAFMRVSCPKARCSRFDRSDGENVWFVEDA